MDEGFTFDPPTMDTDTNYGFIPPNQEAAWMLHLIKVKIENTNLPDDVKKTILTDMEPYINNASMTNITQGQVREFLGGYKEIWMKYYIFINKKKYKQELTYLETRIREILIQNLNKSIQGWQGNHVFERKSTSTYDVKQHNISETTPVGRIRGILGRKKQQETNE